MTDTAPIGLIYLHDYYYQANQVSCQAIKNKDYANCISQGWMHQTNNDGSTFPEWTMSRHGRYDDRDSSFYAWHVDSYGRSKYIAPVMGDMFVQSSI